MKYSDRWPGGLPSSFKLTFIFIEIKNYLAAKIGMYSFIDQIGGKVNLHKAPQRIISLVPSQTELLYDLGLEAGVIGITKFCVHPPVWFKTKTRIGGTKEINIDKIHQLRPDLIIANKEENVKEQIEELAKHYPVWVSDVNNLTEACSMIRQIGEITGTQTLSEKITADIQREFSKLKKDPESITKAEDKPVTAYLIWHKPYMTAGGDTFINAMMEAAGLDNVFKNKTRYPETSVEELKNKNINLLLLSSEPYPFKQKHIDELQKELPETKIILADGEMFSWYGSRLLQAPGYFIQLLKEINEQ
jgi:ABC-type Fe3+-hydroxamate transport system substrate-binding protein